MTLRPALAAATRYELGASGDPARAVAFAERHLAEVERVARGPETSADVGEALLRVVEARRRSGAPFVELRPLLERAIRCLSNGYGPDHLRTRAARNLLGGRASQEAYD